MDIFVDGSYCPYTKRSGIGIWANPLISISLNVDAPTALYTEFMAVLLAATNANHGDTIYSDCLVVVTSYFKYKLIVRHEEISELTHKELRNKNIKLKWIKREKNTYADILARKGRKIK